MTRKNVAFGMLFVFALLLTLSGSAQAEDLQQGMTQGDFSVWLIKAINAQDKLPPAFGPEEAINFLTQLGSIPEGGWQKNEEMTTQALASLLENSDEVTGLSWDELVEKVREHIQNIFDNRKLGVFRIHSPTPADVEIA